MFSKLIIVITAFIVILVPLHLYLYHQVQKKPYNNPSHFIHNDKPDSNKQVIVCIGDSITHGTVSYNYVNLLSQRLDKTRFELVNAGVNRDLAYHVLQRLDEVIKCDPDFITILIGANDAYASLSRENAVRATESMKLPEIPSQDCFRETLTKICSQLSAHTKAEIALLSLPPIGEELDHIAYRQAMIYSRIIKEVASNEKLNYIPLHETMSHYLKSQNNKPKLSLNSNLHYVMYKGILLHYILGVSFDEISSSNGFLLSTDFLHLNSKGAKMIADLIRNFVTKEPLQ